MVGAIIYDLTHVKSSLDAKVGTNAVDADDVDDGNKFSSISAINPSGQWWSVLKKRRYTI